MNQGTLLGRLTADPRLRTTGSGKVVASITLAYNNSYSKTEETLYFDLSAWDKKGESLAKHFRKGDQILVSYRLVRDVWVKDGVKIEKIRGVILDWFFVGSKGSPAASLVVEDDLEDVPFG